MNKASIRLEHGSSFPYDGGADFGKIGYRPLFRLLTGLIRRHAEFWLTSVTGAHGKAGTRKFQTTSLPGLGLPKTVDQTLHRSVCSNGRWSKPPTRRLLYQVS